ncbi:MAG: TonB-dependent receptor [Odoribacteraceae bacterium]|nr:TonB-dependent receptor [Odoribacteraceae bacterium]
MGVKGGSFGLVNPSLSSRWRLPGGASISVVADYLGANGKYKHRYANGAYDTTITRQNGDLRVTRAEVGARVPLDAGTALAVRGYLYFSNRGLPGAVLAGRFSNAQRQTDRSVALQASVTRERAALSMKYSRDYSRYTDPSYPVEGGLVSAFREEEWYLSATWTRPAASWCDVAVAVDAARDALSGGMAGFAGASRWSFWGALSGEARGGGAVAQASLLACAVEERGAGKGHRVWCPVVSASWQPPGTRGLYARAFFKRSFRVPTFNDLYQSYPVVASLRPEFATQWNAGVTWERTREGTLASLVARADAYRNRVVDKIVALPAGNVARWTMLNLGRVTVTGVELSGGAGVSPSAGTSLEVGVTYVWQRAVDDTPGDTRGRLLPYAPLHSGTATATAGRGAWRWRYSFIYTGTRFSRRDNAEEGREPPWYTHDVSLGYRGAWRGVSFRVDGEVSNLLNHYYAVVRNYPMPGRSCRLNLSVII